MLMSWQRNEPMHQVIEIIQHKNLFFVVNIMGSDVLATQAVSASTIMMLIVLEKFSAR